MRKLLLLPALALLFGINGHAPAFAGGAAECVSPAQIQAEDQAKLDEDARLAGYTSVVLATIEGDAAKRAAKMLISIGAPDSFNAVDVIVILNAVPPEGKEPMGNRHVVGFAGGCKTEAGYLDAPLAGALVGEPI